MGAKKQFQVSGFKFPGSKSRISKVRVSKFRVSKAKVSGFKFPVSKSRDIQIAHCKERGEWAELCFMERAARHGLRVSKPHGESAPYDVVVEWEGRFRRVQVKSTIYRRRGESYSLNVMGPGRKAYRRGVVDFVAVYLIPIDRWYIIPYEALGESKCSVHFKPGGIRQKYEEYREAWERLKGSSQ
ncbi:MAG TPA: group I intron-associated PD-(D/E)XK endonuclease [Terriglobales bacterium]|nr:group I intron-associated PD-(D/E)XK endonuclease [Terriglobales bacterium]